MQTSSLQSGYLVATDERIVTVYPTLEEAEAHIKFQREHMGSTRNWHIIHIKVLDWKVDKIS